jgi:phenylacetic acid degradation operon negative regulatory protein
MNGDSAACCKDRTVTISEAMSTRTLVMGMIRSDGQLIADELYAVGDAGGFTNHQIRLCLARLVADGTLLQAGRGRKAQFELTPAGRREVEPEVEFVRMAFEQDNRLRTWDSTWHLVTFALGEDLRTERNTLREQLVLLGAPLGGGVYVCANNWDDLVLTLADELGVAESVSLAVASTLRVGGETDPKRIARRLWPIDDIAQRWRDFVHTHRRTVERLGRATERVTPEQIPSLLADAIGFIVAFDGCMRIDPLLPHELLPKDWPGIAGRRLLLRGAASIEHLRTQTSLPTLFTRYDDVLEQATRLTTAAEPQGS